MELVAAKSQDVETDAVRSSRKTFVFETGLWLGLCSLRFLAMIFHVMYVAFFWGGFFGFEWCFCLYILVDVSRIEVNSQILPVYDYALAPTHPPSSCEL